MSRPVMQTADPCMLTFAYADVRFEHRQGPSLCPARRLGCTGGEWQVDESSALQCSPEELREAGFKSGHVSNQLSVRLLPLPPLVSPSTFHLPILPAPEAFSFVYLSQSYLPLLYACQRCTERDMTRGTAADCYTPEQFTSMMVPLFERAGLKADLQLSQ